MQKIISFKGIARGGDNLLSPDGECLDVVNMRMKEGSLVPVPRPDDVTTLAHGCSQIYWHEIASHYICVTDDSDSAIRIYDREWNAVKGDDGSQELFVELKGVHGVEFLGYVVCCLTGNGIFYLLFNDGRYRWLGERPPMPSLEIEARSRLQRVITTEKFYISSTAKFESTWEYNSRGYFDECISVLNKEGYFVDRALFRFALRLHDGSYICLSPVLYVSDEESINGVSRDIYNLYSRSYTNEMPSTYEAAVLGFRPEFSFKGLGLEGWESIVMGIDVFTTGSIMGKKVVETGGMYLDGDSTSRVYKRYETYRSKTLDELWNDVVSAGYFYRIAEYDLQGNLVERLDDVSAASLALQQSLADGGVSLRSVTAGCSCMFNNRLHIGSLKEWFFKGYDPFFLGLAYGDKGVAERVVIRSSIRTFGGTSTVIRNYSNVPLVVNDGVYELPPLLSYPDSRAFEMKVSVLVDGSYRSRTFVLSPHRSLDIALYLNRWYLGLRVSARASLSNGVTLVDNSDKSVAEMFSFVAGTHKIVYSKSAGTWMYNGEPFPGERFGSLRIVSSTSDLADGDSITYTLTPCSNDDSYSEICNIRVDSNWESAGDSVDEVEVNPYEARKNVLKVSAVDNPFYFPPECTYTPSQGEVVALASNTVALSQGQFGQHPLYVFCSDGIWANSVDTSGAMAYLASYPLSREVCVNPFSVCGIDSGVVFVGKQGVMLASGGKMVHLSGSMERGDDAPAEVCSDGVLQKIASMMQLQALPGSHGFGQFLQGCRVAYLPSQVEILLANEHYGCCYLYSLQSRMWSRVQLCAKGFVRSYSFVGLFAVDGSRTSVMRIGDEQSGNNAVMLLTRPQLWGSKLPKRVLQLMLHAYAEPCSERNAAMPVLACYMLGSNDGVHFRLIAGRECESRVQDLKFPYFPTQAYRFYMFAVCGEMSGGSMVTALEIEMQPAWGNRMR